MEADFLRGASEAMQRLLSILHWSDGAGVEGVGFSGQPPALRSPHQLAAASAAAIACASVGAVRRWHRVTGQSQRLDIDATQALCALNPGYFQRQNGYRLPSSSLGRELKSDFFPTRDGRWFYPVGSYPHLRDGVLKLLNCPNHAQALATAVSGWDANDLEEAFLEADLPGAYARTRDEWLAHPQGALLHAKPVIEIEKVGESAAEPERPGRRPLDDLRVIDMAHVIAGPVAARTLAEHGADVLRISSPVQPDPLNQVMDTSIGKRNAFLDLERAGDKQKLMDLVRGADVFVQSWKGGSMERRGLGCIDLHRVRPGIVYLSVSAFGSEGPWAQRKGFDQLGQIASGVAYAEAMSASGPPRMAPTYLLNDYLTAYLGAAGVLAALERRAAEGGSYHVKVSLARSSMWLQELGLVEPPAQPQRLEQLSPALRSWDTAFGLLDQMEPVARLSRTPARWTLPPSPLGSALPKWESDEGMKRPGRSPG